MKVFMETSKYIPIDEFWARFGHRPNLTIYVKKKENLISIIDIIPEVPRERIPEETFLEKMIKSGKKFEGVIYAIDDSSSSSSFNN